MPTVPLHALVLLVLAACTHTPDPKPIPAHVADPIENAFRLGADVAGGVGDGVVDVLTGFLESVGATDAAQRLARWHDPDATCGRSIAAGLLAAAADGVHAGRLGTPGIPAGQVDLSACQGLEGVGIPPAARTLIDHAIDIVESGLDLEHVCEKDPQGAAYGLGALQFVHQEVDAMAGQIPSVLTWSAVSFDAGAACRGQG